MNKEELKKYIKECQYGLWHRIKDEYPKTNRMVVLAIKSKHNIKSEVIDPRYDKSVYELPFDKIVFGVYNKIKEYDVFSCFSIGHYFKDRIGEKVFFTDGDINTEQLDKDYNVKFWMYFDCPSDSLDNIEKVEPINSRFEILDIRDKIL